MNSGIYFIKNIKNGYVYVGSSVNIKTRMSAHFSNLRKNKHINKTLQKDFNEFGENNFIFRILENCDHKNLLLREQYWESKIKKSYSTAIKNEVNIDMSIDNHKIELFKSLIVKLDNGCWKINLHHCKNGYCLFRINQNKKISVHRFSYWLFKNKDINGNNVCHSCDNKYCVNPDHLFLGSCHENHRDRADKGIGCIFNKKIAKKIRNLYRDYKNIHYIIEFLSIMNFKNIKKRSIYSVLENRVFYDPEYIYVKQNIRAGELKVSEIRKDRLLGMEIVKIMEKYNIKYRTLIPILNYKSWKNVEPAK